MLALENSFYVFIHFTTDNIKLYCSFLLFEIKISLIDYFAVCNIYSNANLWRAHIVCFAVNDVVGVFHFRNNATLSLCGVL